MSQQTTITSYFGKRKRNVADEYKLKAKKILLDDDGIHCSAYNENSTTQKIKPNETPKIENEKFSEGIWHKGDKSTGVNHYVPEKITKYTIAHDVSREEVAKREPICLTAANTTPVKFKLMGSLSPTKKNGYSNKNLGEAEKNVKVQEYVERIHKTPQKQIAVAVHPELPRKVVSSNSKCTTEDVIKSAKEVIKRIKQTQKKAFESDQLKMKKELSLKEVKDKLRQSAKLNELKKSINKINEQAAVLIELERNKKQHTVPRLSKFKAIEVDVPPSPQKNALYSPSKIERSPAKSAYERFSSLAESNTTLPLPFAFQKLYELFRGVDTVSSMMMNRGEDITFSKLKPAVQEMTRKSFTMRHLAQMASVLPSAFTFHQEKVKNFGSTSKVDRYDLVITPTFPDSSQAGLPVISNKDDIFHLSDRMSMTPRIMKARREAFYNALLDKTKDCHEEFLRSLDPPMQINRNDLKRWHPNFMVDHVPDIVPKELPQPPNSERPATAKEVLERAKDFLSSNGRLKKALESASQTSEELKEDITSIPSPEIKEKVDSRLNNPLKGISKSLLERVRARQAAKALDSMRMTPQQEKETVLYNTLPSIARIVRILFVNEQRGALSWETVLEKVQFSYNRNISRGDVETHLKLLIKLLPEWLSVVHIRNGNYLKSNPTANLASVMSKLDKIVAEKTKNN